ncbi:MAG: Dyp-type peroxidase [Candidatus Binatia bacterium]
MGEEKKSGRISRRDFIRAAGVGALAAGIGTNISILHGSEDLLDQTNIDPNDPRFRPMLEELQGNILSSHGRDHSLHIFLQFNSDPDTAKKWVRSFARNYVTSAKKQASEADRFRHERTSGGLFANFFLSARGYVALGFSLQTIPSDRSFLSGMKSNGTRSKLNDPEVSNWEEGFQDEIHALILLADDSREKLDHEEGIIREEVEKVANVLTVEVGNRLKRNGQGIEPFGYADGISQPLFLKGAIERAKSHGTSKWDPSAPLALVLLEDPGGPTGHSFGTYLVYRKLEQNVAGFKRRRRTLAEKLGIDEELAGALAVGRFRNGTPVALQSTPELENISNNFDYADDRDGTKCPFHAHIRKTNPRGDSPDGVRGERRHRIVRRSTAFGAQNLPLEPTEGVGLLFMCYQSSIVKQFEFMQSSWANKLHFPRQNTGLDPIGGLGEQLTGGQLWPRRWGSGLDSNDLVHFDFSGLVSMKGGEYFFSPSIGFLRQIE